MAEAQSTFYMNLSEEPIDNTYNQVGAITWQQTGGRGGPSPELVNGKKGGGWAGVLAHLTRTKRKRQPRDSTMSPHSLCRAGAMFAE